jgi:hypothetical protein
MGKLAPKVVEKRTAELQEFINALLSHSDPTISTSDILLAFLEAKDGMVKVGAAAPTNTVTDIHGRAFDPSAYGSDWLIIYSAASRLDAECSDQFDYLAPVVVIYHRTT